MLYVPPIWIIGYANSVTTPRTSQRHIVLRKEAGVLFQASSSAAANIPLINRIDVDVSGYTFIDRGSYTSGHFMWNLWSEPSASFINSYKMTTSEKLCLSYDPLNEILSFSNEHNFIRTRIVNKDVVNDVKWLCKKWYNTCGHIIFMPWRYQLNKHDVIW